MTSQVTVNKTWIVVVIVMISLLLRTYRFLG